MWREKNAAGAFFFFFDAVSAWLLHLQLPVSEWTGGRASIHPLPAYKHVDKDSRSLTALWELEYVFQKREPGNRKNGRMKKKVIDNCRNSHKMSQEKETWQHVRLDVHARLFFFLQEQTVGGLQIRQHPMSASLKPALHAVTCRYKKKKSSFACQRPFPLPLPHSRTQGEVHLSSIPIQIIIHHIHLLWLFWSSSSR